MDDIASKMGISKKTIYQSFVDKESLVVAVITSIIQHNQKTCDIDRKRASDAIHEIFLAMEQMSQLFHHMNPSILFDLHKYYPQGYEVFKTHTNNYLYDVIQQNLKRGIREALYREDMHIETIARYRIESIVIPFNPEFHLKVKRSLANIAEELSTHFLFGIVSSKGYKLTLKYLQSKSINK